MNKEQAICIQCFNHYISAEDYLNNLEIFEARVSRAKDLADTLCASLKNSPKNINIDLVNQLFKGLSLTEIEQMIGLPENFGSFDYGIEAGKWKLGNFLIEIWFKNQTCTEAATV